MATARLTRALLMLLSVCATLTGVVGCGDARPSPVAIRVGRATIDERSVNHWTAAITRGAIVADPSSDPSQPPRRQAISFLIYSNWLIGEVTDQGILVPKAQLVREVREQEESAPEDHSEYMANLARIGETTADVQFEAKARWAASVVRRRVGASAGRLARQAVTRVEVERYYASHIAHYRLKERRYYDLIERIRTRAAARRLARRLGPGRAFAKAAVKEQPVRPKSFAEPPEEGHFLRVVFSSKVGVIVGPMRLHGEYAMFVLRRITPARVQPLSEVRATIEKRLYLQARRVFLARIVASDVKAWTARTDCTAAYVVQKCEQYEGPIAAEGEPFAGA